MEMKFFINRYLLFGLLSFVSTTLSSCGKNSSQVENILGFFAGVALFAYVIGYFSAKPTNPKYFTKADSMNSDAKGIGNVIIVIILAVIVLIFFGLSKLMCKHPF